MRMAIHEAGPIFQANIDSVVKEESGYGIDDMLAAGVDFVQEEIQPGNGYRSGAFHSSIHKQMFGTNLAGSVQADITKPIRTWLERGTRKGRRLRKGSYFFAHGKAKLKALDPDKFFTYRIRRRLN